MKKGTIFKNLWAGHETYFCYQRQSKLNGLKTGYGYSLVNVNGEWRLDMSHYYKWDLENDREHFFIVGHADIDEVIKTAILEGITDAS